MIPLASQEELKNVNDLIAEITAKGDASITEILERWRQQIVLMIADSRELDSWTIDTLKARLTALSRQVTQRLVKEMSDNQRRQFIKGVQTVDRVIKSGGINSALPFMSEEKLKLLQKYSANQITGLVDNAIKNITAELDMAFLGQKTAGEVIANIGKNLTDASIFGTIAKRANVIYQTEIKRMQNIATHDRIQQVKQQVRDIGKKWLHSHIGVPRPYHLLLNGTVIGADEQFELIGSDGTSYMVDAPHDPILPVGEVANCRCTVVPVVMRFLEEGE